MRRLSGLAAATTAALVLAGCASTMTVSSHVQYGIDFGNFRTYTWGPADAFPTGDPRLDVDPFFRDHLQGAVEKRLAGRGFLLSEGPTADLLVHYHAAINHSMDVNRFDHDHGYCYDADCSVRVMDVEAGTIVLDIIDARTNRLLWRGWAQTRVDDMLKNQDRMARKLEEAAERMLAQLPRAGVVTARPMSQTGGR
jgi:hypothetical protein